MIIGARESKTEMSATKKNCSNFLRGEHWLKPSLNNMFHTSLLAGKKYKAWKSCMGPVKVGRTTIEFTCHVGELTSLNKFRKHAASASVLTKFALHPLKATLDSLNT
jgi:hypothetical protein